VVVSGPAAGGENPAKSGVFHWWAERLTAAALVPLILWLVVSLVRLTGADHAAVTAWLGSPVAAVLLILTVAVALIHAALGLEVVIEDYVQGPRLRDLTLVAAKSACALIGLGAVLAVLRIAFSG
jgi:succinate dehydrogenase / fumarate reductase membrane anchor subunit